LDCFGEGEEGREGGRVEGVLMNFERQKGRDRNPHSLGPGIRKRAE